MSARFPTEAGCETSKRIVLSPWSFLRNNGCILSRGLETKDNYSKGAW